MKNRERKPSESFSSTKSSDYSTNDKVNIEVSNAVEQKTKVVVTGDSLLNGIHEQRLSKNHNVKVNCFPSGTGQTILENPDKPVTEQT